jgi:hypothetical protein
MILSGDGDRHRAMRKMFAQHIGTRATVNGYREVQEVEVRRFILAVYSDPKEILRHIRS